MKLIILRTNLKEGLSALERAATDNSQLPILKNVLLRADKQLVLAATNLEIGVTYTAAGKIVEPGSITVPLAALHSIITNSASERINLETHENTLEVQTDNYDAKIQGISSEDFPIIPKIEDNTHQLEIEAAALQEALTQVVGATQVSDLKPELHSVLIKYESGALKFAATDGFRLAEKTLLDNSFTTNFTNGFSVIVPLKTVSEVLRIFPTDSTVRVQIDPHQIVFTTDSIELVSRLIDAEYPDYTQIIPKAVTSEVVVSRSEFLAGLKLVSGFSGKGSDIRLKIREGGGELEIYAADQYVGENNYLVPIKKYQAGEVLELSFNWRYLIDGIRPLVGEQISLGFSSEAKPAIIKPVGDDSVFYIVMPINPN
ncbi:MAG: DNA polymerase III subunit beta [Candidatus Harrisonbacteria bacterium CG10_big_fil_rev_8_21_14_0_10_49_15]|uniref:Beta sliding clamp n=1 Tax=Candidatus Harrisonbacteria bacterium CG10_big_fil_rev_8_21_14_0_10_49_15 TaxID=1974587 RepID=A0A2H0UKC4_9BACT|nr:MAG: DNA polymerase III subunit beta [Candidatus Harrisonbacteria bacterium CG10_big_fil_rev_8_21_14_0_10_49_15]